MKKEDDFNLKTTDKKEQTVKIPTDVLNDFDSIELDLKQTLSETEMVLGRKCEMCVCGHILVCSPWSQRKNSV